MGEINHNIDIKDNKKDESPQGMSVMLSLLLIIFFGFSLSTQTFTTQKMCKLINKGYKLYSCTDNIDPCGQNYKLLYDVQIIDKQYNQNETNIVQMCAGSSFSTLQYPECTCAVHDKNKHNETIETIQTITVYKYSGECEPIFVSDLKDYDSKIIGQIFECWVGSNGIVAPNNKSNDLITLEITSFVMIFIGFLFILYKYIVCIMSS